MAGATARASSSAGRGPDCRKPEIRLGRAAPERRAPAGAVRVALAVIALVAAPDAAGRHVDPPEAAQHPVHHRVGGALRAVVAEIMVPAPAGGIDQTGGVLDRFGAAARCARPVSLERAVTITVAPPPRAPGRGPARRPATHPPRGRSSGEVGRAHAEDAGFDRDRKAASRSWDSGERSCPSKASASASRAASTRGLVAPDQRPGRRQRPARQGGQAGGLGDGLLHQHVGRQHRVDEAERLRLVGVERPRQEQQLGGLEPADPQGQKVARRRLRHEAELHEGHAQPGRRDSRRRGRSAGTASRRCPPRSRRPPPPSGCGCGRAGG